MICAEVRRRLPEPDGERLSEVTAHLASCPPCRGEADALREVDRRLVLLGQARARIAEGGRPLLERSIETHAGLRATELGALNWLRAGSRWLPFLLAMTAILALWFRLRHRLH